MSRTQRSQPRCAGSRSRSRGDRGSADSLLLLWSAQREQQLAVELSEVAGGLSNVASARAAQALLAPVESRVAQAEATRLTLLGVEARQRATTGQAVLATLFGLSATAPPSIDVRAVEPDPRVLRHPPMICLRSLLAR